MTQTATADGGVHNDQIPDSYHAFKRAREAMGEVLGHVLDEEGFDRYVELQQQYFSLMVGEKARDPEFQHVEMDGTRLNIPQSNRVFEDPSTEVKNGELLAATRHDDFRVLDSVSVLDPENSPSTTHTVTVDHVVTTEGEVSVEVNGVPLDEVGERQGSYIR